MLHGILPWHGHGILKINQIIRKKTKKQTKKNKKNKQKKQTKKTKKQVMLPYY